MSDRDHRIPQELVEASLRSRVVPRWAAEVEDGMAAADFFAGTVLPARTALAVAGLPLGARVEIEITLITLES